MSSDGTNKRETKSAAMRQRVDVLRQIIDDHELCLSALNRAKRTIRLVQKQLNEQQAFTPRESLKSRNGWGDADVNTASSSGDSGADDIVTREHAHAGHDDELFLDKLPYAEKISPEEVNVSSSERLFDQDEVKEEFFVEPPVEYEYTNNSTDQNRFEPGDENKAGGLVVHAVGDYDAATVVIANGIVGEEKVSEEELYDFDNFQHGEKKVSEEDFHGNNGLFSSAEPVGMDQYQDEMLARRLQEEKNADQAGVHPVVGDSFSSHSPQSEDDTFVDIDADERLARALQAEEDGNDNEISLESVDNEDEEELPASADDEALLCHEEVHADTNEIMARELQAAEDYDEILAGDGVSIGSDDDEHQDVVHVDIEADARLARALQAEEDADYYSVDDESIYEDDVEHHATGVLHAEDEPETALDGKEMQHQQIGEDFNDFDELIAPSEEVKYGEESGCELSNDGEVAAHISLNCDKNYDEINNTGNGKLSREEKAFREEKVGDDEICSHYNVGEEDMKETIQFQDSPPLSLERNFGNKSKAENDAIAEKSTFNQQLSRSIIDHDQDELEERITRYFMTQQDEELARRLQTEEEEAAIQENEIKNPSDSHLQDFEDKTLEQNSVHNDIGGPSFQENVESVDGRREQYVQSHSMSSFDQRSRNNNSMNKGGMLLRRTQSANADYNSEERALPRRHLDPKFHSISEISTIHEDEVEDKIGNFNRARLSRPPQDEPVAEEKKPQGLRRGFDSLMRRSKELRRNRDLIKLEKDDRNILRELWSMQAEEDPDVGRKSYLNLAA